uniref:HTH_48 domain-containing protein n=1 Tax=Glossina austeni TaxID=7395 RepID=A0A1A9V5Q6_GLOAU
MYKIKRSKISTIDRYATRLIVIKMRVDSHTHIRHIMLYHFEKGWKALCFRNLNEHFGEGSISESRCREWFARLKSGGTNLEHKPGRGRPSYFDEQAYLATVEGDHHGSFNHRSSSQKARKDTEVGWMDPQRTHREQ